jgi:hypothetical protein
MAEYGARLRVQIIGGDALLAALEAMDAKVHNRIVKTAIREGVRPFVKRAKYNARTLVGGNMGEKLSKLIVARKQKKWTKKFVYIMSAWQKGIPEFVHVSKTDRRTYIPSAIEYGHGSHKKQAAIPYMRQAFDSTKDEMYKIVASEVAKGIASGVNP